MVTTTGAKTGGRKRGTPNKATAEVRDLAREYAPAALKELARLMKNAESEAARVSAIKEILDRGYGKAIQKNENDNLHDVTDPMLELLNALRQPVFPKDDGNSS